MDKKLNIITDQKTIYNTDDFVIDVNGYLPYDGSSMKVNLKVRGVNVGIRWRGTIDLFEYNQISKQVEKLFEDLDVKHLANTLEATLIELGELLDEHRIQQALEEDSSGINLDGSHELTNAAEKEAVEFLEQDDLIDNLGNAIESSGVIGNHNAALAAFLVGVSFHLKKPLHAIVQGTSGAGKSHIIEGVANLIPQESTVRITRATSKSFYNYRDKDLQGKLLIIEDLNGLDEEGEFALREMQSAGFLSSSTVTKGRFNNDPRSKVKTVRVHFSTLATTTSNNIVYDNESRSIMLGVDESQSQSEKVVEYQNQRHAGKVDGKKEEEIRTDIRNVVRKLKPMSIVNPFAGQIKLPFEGLILRRLNQQLNNFIEVVVLLHQYQRDIDDEGRLVAILKDVTTAIDIMFDSIILKVDDLDSSVRQFFEELKLYVEAEKKKAGDNVVTFKERDIREQLKRSKAHTSRYLKVLHELEYLERSGHPNKGFEYELVYAADIKAKRKQVLDDLQKQIASVSAE